MPTPTTSAQLIREDRRNIVESLNPAQLNKVKFREYNRDGDFREWAEANPAACFRRFQIRDLATYEIPLISDMVAEEVQTQFEVIVAYPADGRFGSDIVNGLEDAIRSDQVRIESRIGAMSNANYPSGLNLFQLASVEIEREGAVYFLSCTFDVDFYRAVDLGLTNLSGTLACTASLSAAISQKHATSGTLAASSALSGNATRTASLSGTLAATGSLSGNITELGPNLLADFNFATPTTVGIGGNGTFASSYATDEWLLQETSGTYANNVGTETLSNTGGLQGQTAVGLWDGSSYVARNAWESDSTVANADQLVASGTTAGDSDGEDFAVRIVYRIKGAIASLNHFASKRNGNNEGWSIYTGSSDRVSIAIEDAATNTVTLTCANNGVATDGSWGCIDAWYDQSADMLYIKTNLVSESSVSTSGVGSITVANALKVNGKSTTDGQAGVQYAYVGVSVGANAQNFYDETVVLPGTDPSGLLTTISRGSLISGQCDATHVYHAAADTLPQFYNGNFSDTNKLGLYCNSAVTNLITYSEALSNWTQSGTTTTTDNQTDQRDGFRSMSKITAGAANDFIKETVTTVASTEYTFRAVVLESTVGCTGRLIIYDETGAAELASQTFTCTSTHQEVSVTATTNVGQVSTSLRIEIDTSGEHLFAGECQYNLGDARGAYIRTSGASAALVANTYRAVAAAGTLASAAAGEVEAIVVGAFNNGQPINSSYIVDIGDGTTINNRRFIWLASNGDIAQSYGYDSSGTFAWILGMHTGTRDFTSQESTLTLRWDATGGLALGGGEDAETLLGGVSQFTDVGTFTSTDAITDVKIGALYGTGSAGATNAFIQRIRIWDGER